MKRLLLLVLVLVLVAFSFSQVTSETSPIAGSTDQTTLGTVTTGVWNGTALVDAYVTNALTIEATVALKNTVNAGASPIGTCVATEYGDGYNHVTLLTLTDFIIGAPSASNNLAIGNIVYTFPAGVQVIGFMEYNIALTAGTQTDDTPEIGIGSVIGSGAIATLDNGTMEDYILSNAWSTTLDGVAGEILGPLGASAGVHTGIALNQAGDSKNVLLNSADGWHASITGNLTATGTIKIVWTTIE